MAVVNYTVIDGEIISEVRGGVRKDYVPDPLGSTVALLDNTQTKTDTWEYWPYGEIRSGSSATPLQFVGTLGYYKDTSSRTYVRARHYRQALGRWQTVDPFWPQLLPYNYVDSDPINLVDFFGEQARPLQEPAPFLRPDRGQSTVPIPGTPPTPMPDDLGLIGIGVAVICQGVGGAIGDFLKDLGQLLEEHKDVLPIEMPKCPQPPRTPSEAEAHRKKRLLDFGHCTRTKQGKPRPAEEGCIYGGIHQVDTYKCRGKDGKVQEVSASILCCICYNQGIVTVTCHARVHYSTRGRP